MTSTSQSGFSIIEMLIASAILLIGVAGILLSVPRAEEGVIAGGMSGRAALYARERLDSLAAISFEELTNYAGLESYNDEAEPAVFFRHWWVLSAELLPPLVGEELDEELATFGLVAADLDIPRNFLRLKVVLTWQPPGGRLERLEVRRLVTP